MCVRVSGDAPSKSGPRRGVIHDFITQALHKAPSNTPPFLLVPLCFFPMLPFFFHVCPTAFFTLCFLCPLCYFTILRSSMLALFFFPLPCVDLHHSCPYLLLVFDFISILHLFLLLSPPMSKTSCSFLVFSFCLLSVFSFCCFFALQSPSSFSFSLCLSFCKVMQGHKFNLWIETFKTTVSFTHACAGINTQSCTQAITGTHCW